MIVIAVIVIIKMGVCKGVCRGADPGYFNPKNPETLQNLMKSTAKSCSRPQSACRVTGESILEEHANDSHPGTLIRLGVWDPGFRAEGFELGQFRTLRVEG